MNTASNTLNERSVHEIEAHPEEIYDIELEHSLLQANAQLAEGNRALLDSHDVVAIDVMGAIGSGKTTLIARVAERLAGQLRIAVFNGDATTSLDDTDRITQRSVPIVQISTINGCHLDANLVGKALHKIDLAATDLILIENIGNLICPAEFPLGSKARIVVVSVTEGPFMVKKHPHMFLGSDIVVINKIDLAEIMEVNVQKLIDDVHRLKPDIRVIPMSCKDGTGVGEMASLLVSMRRERLYA